jgi:hypothetical protein
MCVVSMVGDYYKEKWVPKGPWVEPYIPPVPMPTNPIPRIIERFLDVTREEFETQLAIFSAARPLRVRRFSLGSTRL